MNKKTIPQVVEKVYLEHQKDFLGYCFGYLQVHPNDLYLPIVFAFTHEQFYVFNDLMADDCENATLIYKPIMNIPLLKVKKVINQTYKDNLEFEEYGNIIISYKDSHSSSFGFFYKMEDKKEVSDFLFNVKKLAKIKVVSACMSKKMLSSFKGYKFRRGHSL